MRLVNKPTYDVIERVAVLFECVSKLLLQAVDKVKLVQRFKLEASERDGGVGVDKGVQAARLYTVLLAANYADLLVALQLDIVPVQAFRDEARIIDAL